MLRDESRRENAQAFGRDCGAVIDEVYTLGETLHRGDIAAIRLLEVDSLGKILQVSADHVVAAGDLMIPCYECISQMASEESRCPGYKNFQILIPLKDLERHCVTSTNGTAYSLLNRTPYCVLTALRN